MVEITHFPLKLTFIIHFVLVTWGLQGHWAPSSYLLYNGIFFLTLLWSVHAKDSSEPVQIALLVNVMSVAFDIITMAVCFPDAGAANRFSAAMAVLNIVVRPFSCIILVKVMKERGSDLADIAAFSTPGGILGNPRSYEDLDNPGISQNHSDFNVPSATQAKGPPPYNH